MLTGAGRRCGVDSYAIKGHIEGTEKHHLLTAPPPAPPATAATLGHYLRSCGRLAPYTSCRYLEFLKHGRH
ncbi:hypothetical protein P7K49_021072 [Saguinus oedipus]|uniref:Uncharacterized protein n=1 Tax=Saguinus oedipus TaxID=9490 RepID=A0ABQ9URL2_SAGOE|nr:hypothetical protein P7K49_021072 [Saguinus oedipus]